MVTFTRRFWRFWVVTERQLTVTRKHHPIRGLRRLIGDLYWERFGAYRVRRTFTVARGRPVNPPAPEPEKGG